MLLWSFRVESVMVAAPKVTPPAAIRRCDLNTLDFLSAAEFAWAPEATVPFSFPKYSSAYTEDLLPLVEIDFQNYPSFWDNGTLHLGPMTSILFCSQMPRLAQF